MAPRKMADSSTLTFFFTVVVAFVVIRWFVLGENVDADPGHDTNQNNTNNTNTNENNNNAAEGSSTGSASARRNLRPVTLTRRTVTPDMIEVVKAMAPSLTDEQIEFDLQRTGNIEMTVERYLAEGNLPYPPNYSIRNNATEAGSSNAGSNASQSSPSISSYASSSSNPNSAKDTQKTPSLLDRYDLTSKLDTYEAPSSADENPFKTEKMEWSGNAQTRQNNLKKQREIMILKARKNMEKKLQQEKGKQ